MPLFRVGISGEPAPRHVIRSRVEMKPYGVVSYYLHVICYTPVHTCTICARKAWSYENIYMYVYMYVCKCAVNSPNNGHFGTRPTVRYSGGVLY